MLAGMGIRKSYGGGEIIRGVDVSVKPGAVTLLVGPSGGGKTTLLKCLALLEEPDVGTISVDGDRYTFPRGEDEPPVVPPWPRLTVVFQQHFLWPHLTMRQNILLPLGDLSADEMRSYEELVDLFEMAEFVDRFPNEVSIGQRQRVALARALVLSPKYILMDEITAALDVEQIHTIFRHLLQLRERGIGILLITHLLGLARSILSQEDGDRIVFLDDGEVLESGGLQVLERPQHPRLAEFLSKMQLAS